MWSKFRRLGRRTRIALVSAVSVVVLTALAAGGLVVADRHPDTLLTLLGARSRPDLLVIAHRGASDEAPENTLAAFRKAREAGADGVECDVVFTKDDVPVISHDDDLSQHRIKKAGAWIKDLSLDEVKQIDVGSWFSPRFAAERFPTLREGLDDLSTWARRVYLHDKETNDYAGPRAERIKTFARQIRESGMADRAVVMVAGQNYELWRGLAPDIHALSCWMMESNHEQVLKLEGYGSPKTTYLGMHVVFLGPLNSTGRFFQSLGLPRVATALGQWPTRVDMNRYHDRPSDFVVFTINDPLQMLHYAQRGFDAIGTDKPRLMLATLRREPRREASR